MVVLILLIMMILIIMIIIMILPMMMNTEKLGTLLKHYLNVLEHIIGSYLRDLFVYRP